VFLYALIGKADALGIEILQNHSCLGLRIGSSLTASRSTPDAEDALRAGYEGTKREKNRRRGCSGAGGSEVNDLLHLTLMHKVTAKTSFRVTSTPT
jgi:hypothetical protein